MAEVGVSNENLGHIRIADEVIATITGTAALEVEGVAGLGGVYTGEFYEKIAKKNLSKGVKVVIDEQSACIDLNIAVKHGYKVQDVSAGVQAKVKETVEMMTGLVVETANIVVSAVALPQKTKKGE